MFELRPYQKSSKEAAIRFLEKNRNPNKRGILIEPTGSGKSVITAAIANERKEGVLVLQPSKELLEQNYSKFTAYGGHAAIYSASMGQKDVSEVTFATIGSLKGKQELFSHVRDVLIDECHLVPPAKKRKNGSIEHSMFTEFIDGLSGVNVVGLTATPFRLKKFNDPFTGEPYSQINLLNRMLPKFFTDVLHVTQIAELYEQRFLTPTNYIPLHWTNEGLKVNSTGAEFSDDSVDRAMVDQEVITRIPGIVRQARDKGQKHILVFVNSIADAEYLTTVVQSSAAVSSQTKKKEREELIEKFRAGEIQTVFNVGVLTTGFDFPELDTIIIGRPTMSLALYMQMIGRGIRLAPGKTHCSVVDMCGNYNRFGKIETIEYRQQPGGRLWELVNDGKVLSNVKLKP